MFLKAKKRGIDSMGSGAYGASRGSRTHNGVDLCADPGESIHSHVSGIVTKFGRPYAPSNNSEKDVLKSALRYVEIQDSDGDKHRFFYVKALPELEIGSVISIADEIGTAANLNEIWPTMKNHIHYEVKRDGKHINPEHFLPW